MTNYFKNLNNFGIYGKFMRTIANIYVDAFVIIDVKENKTDRINVTKGVLQGDPISAEFYILCTSDMDNHFKCQGFKGIKTGPNDNVLMITFAIDTVFFANSITGCQDLLNCLLDYCNINDVIVNKSKTNILTFFKWRPTYLRTVYYTSP